MHKVALIISGFLFYQSISLANGTQPFTYRFNTSLHSPVFACQINVREFLKKHTNGIHMGVSDSLPGKGRIGSYGCSEPLVNLSSSQNGEVTANVNVYCHDNKTKNHGDYQCQFDMTANTCPTKSVGGSEGTSAEAGMYFAESIYRDLAPSSDPDAFTRAQNMLEHMFAGTCRKERNEYENAQSNPQNYSPQERLRRSDVLNSCENNSQTKAGKDFVESVNTYLADKTTYKFDIRRKDMAWYYGIKRRAYMSNIGGRIDTPEGHTYALTSDSEREKYLRAMDQWAREKYPDKYKAFISSCGKNSVTFEARRKAAQKGASGRCVIMQLVAKQVTNIKVVGTDGVVRDGTYTEEGSQGAMFLKSGLAPGEKLDPVACQRLTINMADNQHCKKTCERPGSADCDVEKASSAREGSFGLQVAEYLAKAAENPNWRTQALPEGGAQALKKNLISRSGSFCNGLERLMKGDSCVSQYLPGTKKNLQRFSSYYGCGIEGEIGVLPTVKPIKQKKPWPRVKVDR